MAGPLHTPRAPSVALALCLALVACGDDASPVADASTPDGGAGSDATPPDGGAQEGGISDAAGDAVTIDSGLPPECADRPARVAPARGEAAGVLDAAGGRVVVFGGNAAAPENCIPRTDIVSELWAFELDCHTWAPIDAMGGPGPRARHDTTLDTARGRMIVFGGRTQSASGGYQNYNDVWAFDLATDTWSEIETQGEGPSPRSNGVTVYDEARDRLVVFGGNVSTSGLELTGVNDLYELDLATGTWSPIDAADPPPPRLMHGGVVMDGELFIFGGLPMFQPPYHNDTYALDLETDTWRLVHPGGSEAPRPRFGHEIFADGERSRIVLVMGHDDTDLGNSNDVWALDVAGGEWSRIRPGDELNNEAAGLCDFPSDFTVPEEGAPERRHQIVHAQAGATATGYVLFGKTDCGNINDAWRIDLSVGTWGLLGTPTEGEACNRTGSTTCTELCF